MAGVTGKWVHVHEEDAEGAMVFRPASHPLPPSRGRTVLDLRSDGTYAQQAPGPVDVPVASEGKWALEGGRLVVGERSFEVAAAEGDRLVLRP